MPKWKDVFNGLDSNLISPATNPNVGTVIPYDTGLQTTSSMIGVFTDPVPQQNKPVNKKSWSYKIQNSNHTFFYNLFRGLF